MPRKKAGDAPAQSKKINVSPMQLFKAEQVAAQSALRGIANDGFDNFVAKLGINNQNVLSAGTYEFNYITRNRVKLEAAYRGSWVVGKIVDAVAEDMTRSGIDITTNDGDEEIKDFQTYMSRKKIWTSLCSLIKWGRLYGGAIGVMQIEGQALDTPLDPSTVAKGQFKGIVVYDRWMLNPNLSKVINFGPDMGLPAYYQIVNQLNQMEPNAPTPTGEITVHHSRCIRYTGIDLPWFQAITEMMWGESILERLWDRLISFDSATMSSANLIERANNRMVGIENLREIIAAGGEAQKGLLKQFEMMQELQTNMGLTLLDKNDEYKSDSYTFAGLDSILLQFAQQLSGAADVPLIRLFSQTPTGLSATGEVDIRMYYDMINAQQEAKLRNPFETLLQVCWRSKFGTPQPDDLEFTFTPLWQMDAVDKANVAKTNTETVAGAYEAGLTTRSTAMKELRQNSSDSGLFSNITDEEIEEAEEEPLMPDEAPLPGMDPNAPDPAQDPNTKPVPSFGGSA